MLDIPTESVKYTPAKSLEELLQGDRNIHTLCGLISYWLDF